MASSEVDKRFNDSKNSNFLCKGNERKIEGLHFRVWAQLNSVMCVHIYLDIIRQCWEISVC